MFLNFLLFYLLLLFLYLISYIINQFWIITKSKLWAENLEYICVFVTAEKAELQVLILRSVHNPHQVKSGEVVSHKLRSSWINENKTSFFFKLKSRFILSL